MRISSPFHNALLEQNLRFCATRFLVEARRALPALFSCQRTVALRPAGQAKLESLAENKKPGVERRANPADCGIRAMLDSFLSGIRS
jgi:hypothetical protein